ncbi:hypothetical protein AVEN_107367-1 [Araneus ventricosus]|uniref:Fibrinogen C-terminal domain-containing protein n=2 Tax=Araneus ventricosus TaxID=182803 RepID=A0A4Y2HVL2_ARAVE|nr:hypothetical protein AVEN_54967-1 [Araneus ventricosus]GBM69305.1 hypothetical protein AVEN_107367-1 [Araneus ventricosus]
MSIAQKHFVCKFQMHSNKFLNAGPKHERPMDCAELMENGVTESGVYTIYPRARLAHCQSIDVYCDMETDGGGWTVSCLPYLIPLLVSVPGIKAISIPYE